MNLFPLSYFFLYGGEVRLSALLIKSKSEEPCIIANAIRKYTNLALRFVSFKSHMYPVYKLHAYIQ